MADAGPFEPIRFDDEKKGKVAAYLTSPEVKEFRPALEETAKLIDGFESPLGLELLATVDWLISEDKVQPTVEGVVAGLRSWSGGNEAAERKLRLFDNRLIEVALSQLAEA